MSTPYAGDDTVFPADFLIPDDGDDEDAASVDVPIEALADRTAYLKRIATVRCDEFLASGTWTCPDDVTTGLVEGYGGGGSGAGGNAGTATNADKVCGGSGGGGALMCSFIVRLVPTTVYTITIPAAATGAIAGSNGADGGDVTFGSLATFKGGGKGFSALSSDATLRTTAGGNCIANGTQGDEHGTTSAPLLNRWPSCGGAGIGHDSRPGQPSVQGFAGGAAGAIGADVGANLGGGGGGGGGAGPGGAGGAGGAGGSGGSGGAGAAGSVGVAAAANTGAGGGGGGGGGNANAVSGGAGAAGADGGTGRIRITYSGSQAVIT